VVQRDALAIFDQDGPLRIDVAQLLFILQATAAVSEIFLIDGVLLERS
jgi:hypothetical protein